MRRGRAQRRSICFSAGYPTRSTSCTILYFACSVTSRVPMIFTNPILPVDCGRNSERNRLLVAES